MRNPQFYVSGKRSIDTYVSFDHFVLFSLNISFQLPIVFYTNRICNMLANKNGLWDRQWIIHKSSTQLWCGQFINSSGILPHSHQRVINLQAVRYSGASKIQYDWQIPNHDHRVMIKHSLPRWKRLKSLKTFHNHWKKRYMFRENIFFLVINQ